MTGDPSAGGPRHLLDIDNLSPTGLQALLEEAAAYKVSGDPGPGPQSPLAGSSVVLLFEQPSTRTRVSFESAVTDLCGDPILMGPGETRLSRGESLKDTARWPATSTPSSPAWSHTPPWRNWQPTRTCP